MANVEIRLLGPLEVDVDGRILDVRRQKQRALLALLALRAGEVVPTDRLVDELWGDEPPKAAVGSLQNFVSELRKLLGADVLVTRSPGYLLDIPRDAVDVHRFERSVREAGSAAPEQRAAGLREALGLWRGPALADVQFEDAMVAEAARLEEARLAAWEDRLEAELELGRQSQVIGELESLVAKHRLRERPVGLLMLALYRGGRQADALDAYRRARETLVDELGIDPSPELQRLEQAILRQDSDLDLQAPPPKRAALPEPERRKMVTILFADLVDSTELGAQLDPEVLRSVLTRYFELVRAIVERHGGVVEKFIGDAAMAAFGIPTSHEDDALRAVRASTELRDSVGELNAQLADAHGVALEVRIGVNTGEVLVTDAESGEAFATGAPVNLAMRLEQAAPPGEILLGQSTHRLVRDTVEAETADPVEIGARGSAAAFRVLRVAEAARPLGTAPLLGRADELAWLRAAFAGVQAERRSKVVTLIGDAGVGKTRLTSELLRASGARALVGRCVSYGDGATYLPLVEIVRQAVPERPRAAIAALLEGDDQAPMIAERVTQLAGHAEGAASKGEVFWAVRRFLEALSLQQPLVVVLDDVHWAEPTLLDLVDYLDAWTSKAPFLVVCLARRDLLEARPGWGGTDRVLSLEPLAEGDAGALVAEIAGDELDESGRARIVEVAEGNPLFLEQLLAVAKEAGADALATVPPSVEALLAGRLDRLEPEERALLERAAVIGREFSPSTLVHLTPPAELAALDGRLGTLVRRGLLRQARPDGEDTHRFHHVLVREVAYAGITKEGRAVLHERIGTWLEQREGPDEIVGYHLEQAHRYRGELNSRDDSLGGLAQRAADRLAAAGIRAWKGADVPATINLLTRATTLMADPKQRAETLCELGFAERSSDLAAADATLSRALTDAQKAGDPSIELRAGLELLYLRLFTDRSADPAELVRLVEKAIPVFEEAGNERAIARAWRQVGYVHGSLEGRCAAWLDAAERAIEYYRLTGFSTAGCLLEVAVATFYGPTRVSDGVELLEELLGESIDRLGTANVLVYLGGLNALAERHDDAHALLDEADAIYADIGASYEQADNSGRVRGFARLIADDPVAAEGVFRESYATLERIKDEAALSSVGASLGEALYRQDRLEEARRWAGVAKEHAPAGDKISHVTWRRLEAKLLAREGRQAVAENLAGEALATIEETDALTYHGDVLLDLAAILSHSGRHEEAIRRIEGAIALYRSKESDASLRIAESRLAELAAV
jgi:class 3 adenylate cyclase/tetratricopeptide (TPR) repeat protein